MKTILSICAKCSDMFSSTLSLPDGTTYDYEGYVPNFFPDDHWGDYIMLDIDINTGQILNWKIPTEVDLKQIKHQKIV